MILESYRTECESMRSGAVTCYRNCCLQKIGHSLLPCSLPTGIIDAWKQKAIFSGLTRRGACACCLGKQGTMVLIVMHWNISTWNKLFTWWKHQLGWRNIRWSESLTGCSTRAHSLKKQQTTCWAIHCGEYRTWSLGKQWTMRIVLNIFWRLKLLQQCVWTCIRGNQWASGVIIVCWNIGACTIFFTWQNHWSRQNIRGSQGLTRCCIEVHSLERWQSIEPVVCWAIHFGKHGVWGFSKQWTTGIVLTISQRLRLPLWSVWVCVLGRQWAMGLILFWRCGDQSWCVDEKEALYAPWLMKDDAWSLSSKVGSSSKSEYTTKYGYWCFQILQALLTLQADTSSLAYDVWFVFRAIQGS